jgi:hypothetical protein
MVVEQATIANAAKLVSEQYNAATSQRHYENEVRFSFHNHVHFKRAIEEGRAKDLIAAGKPGENKPIIIIASGFSLDAVLPLLKDWPYPIFISTSQVSTLIYHGREPEYILALDPDCHPGEFAIDTWKDRKSALIIHPAVNPELLEFWKGPILLFRKMQPQTPFYAGAQRTGYSPLGDKEGHRFSGVNTNPWIECQIPMLGCALAAQICIAKQLGFNRMYLVGADFQWTRFTRWSFVEGKWTEEPRESIEESLRKYENAVVPIHSGNKIIRMPNGSYSAPITIFYMHQVVSAWRITECDVVNCSPRSNLTVMPTADFAEVMRKKSEDIKGMSKPEIIETAEQYLALQNIYFFNIGKGIMPREFKDPLSEIPRALNEIKTALVQQGKGDDLDIEANMRRIKKLWEKVAENAS